jgi:hypothetical protein
VGGEEEQAGAGTCAGREAGGGREEWQGNQEGRVAHPGRLKVETQGSCWEVVVGGVEVEVRLLVMGWAA